MNPFSYIALGATIISIFIAVHALWFNPSNRINRAFAMIMTGEAFWSLGYMFIYPLHSGNDIYFWHRVSSIGWIIIPALWVHFALVFSRKDEKRPLWINIFLTVPPALLLWRSWTEGLYAKAFRATSMGNTPVLATDDPWFYAYVLYNIYFVVAAVIFFYFYRKTEQRRDKIQIIIILGAHGVHLFCVYLFNVVFQYIHADIPALGAVSSVISMPFVLYAIMKYRFITFDHRVIMEELFDNVSDMIFLADHNLEVVEINPAAKSISAQSNGSITGNKIQNLFLECDEILDYISKNRETPSPPQKNLECTLAGPLAVPEAVSLFISPIQDELEDFIGLIVIAKKLDILSSAVKKYGITEREKTVFQMVVQGHSLKEIAQKLEIATGTVKNHLHNIYTKTGAQNRMELHRMLFPPT